MSHELKETFVANLGEWEWDESWQSFSELDPEFFRASVGLKAVPKKSRHLSPKVQGLIALAVNSSSTHLYAPGIRANIKEALANGATGAEIKEIIQLTSTLGVHACNVGVPTLVEVMKEEGLYDSHPTAGKPLDASKLQLQKDFTQKRGYWHSFWEEFLALDPDFFAAYTTFSSVPWLPDDTKNKNLGVLEPKFKELIYCAFDAAATHLYRPGLKEHMRNALRYGATVEEILEVLEIASHLSIHTANLAYPILAEELKSKH
ncbi:hypothetical protein COCVIDRAFT_33319 [Bipolaris victoriae FI3]|uniref:Carboxymuconolactone decarboxylase-like domain-containing protein n=1 Tax=Bipolaris victoriae (strain FI3) TaxID=930091 RepID=W7F8I7_BIPV3|nr:hypothetical protein COCVIDRAFT_33319 [Bipolaris victoriae FI3]